MASLPNPRTISYDEWLRMPEVDDAIEEVVDGEIVYMPPAKRIHALIVSLLCRVFHTQLEPDRFDVLDGSFGLVIRTAPLTCRVPDLAIFDRRTVVEKDGYYHSAPQLIVEVLSPGNTRCEIERKLADYASIGVPEVWLISPEARTFEVLYLEDGILQSIRVAIQGGLTPRHFPTVKIDIATIWPD
jgi:Uma2 family endonuclease